MRKTLIGAALAVVVVAAACQPTKPPPPPPPQDVDVVVVGDSVSAGFACKLGDPGQPGAGAPPICPANGSHGFTVETLWAGACTISGGWLMQYNHTSHNTPSCWDWQLTFPAVSQFNPELVIFNTGGWEIQERWANQPCSTTNTFSCPAADRQWANPNGTTGLAAARQAYRSALLQAIDIFRDADTQVLVVNQAYIKPPFVSDPPIWWEAYGPVNPPALWTEPNNLTPFGPSKIKVNNFNAELASAVQSFNDPGVQVFDAWDLFSPNIGEAVGGPRGYHNYVCIDDNDPLSQLEANPGPSGQSCPAGSVGTFVRFNDGGHFNDAGNDLFATAMVPVIQQMLA